MKTRLIFVVLVFFLTIYLANAHETYPTTDGVVVGYDFTDQNPGKVIIEVPETPINYSSKNVNSTYYWNTSDHGALGAINEILHSWLNTASLLWSNAGHTIDENITMNNNSILFDHGAIEDVDYVQFNTSWDNGQAEGRLQWNIEDGTLEVGMPGGNVNLQIGQENFIRAINKEVVEITNGQIVYISGASGAFPEIKVSSNDNPMKARVIGVATENIAINQRGYATTFGLVRDINTSDIAEGGIAWLGINGSITGIRPTSPTAQIAIGIILRTHATEGILYTNTFILQQLSQLSDVDPTGLTNNSILQYVSNTSRFEMTTSPTLENLTIEGEMFGGYIQKYSTGNFTGSLYTSKTNSSASDSNSLFLVMSDTRGTPQFSIQDGGAEQASFVARSFMIVNQNNTLLNSSQNNLCSTWGFNHLDCNTSTTGADFGVTDDAEIIGVLYADSGLRAHTTDFGSYLVLGDRNKLYSGSNGYFNDEQNIFCDFISNNFVSGSLSQWLLINDENSIHDDSRADVLVLINSSCIGLEHNPAWNVDFGPVKWQINSGLNMISQKGGFFEYYVGDDEESKFKVKINNGTGDSGVLIDDIVGVNSHTALSIRQDMNGYSSIGAIINMFSSTQLVEQSLIGLNIIGDASNMNNSNGVFIDMSVVGAPLVAGNIDGMHMPTGLDNLIKVGAADIVEKVYYNAVNITDNVTDVGANPTVFINDNDLLYIGNSDNFTTISIDLALSSSQNVNLAYYYCDAAHTWQPLIGVTESTNGFTNSGTIEFTNPSDRGDCNQQLNGTEFENTTNYTYIALQRTRNFVVTHPIIDRIDISGASTSMFMSEDMLKLHPIDTAPEACTASTLGGIYFDISEDDMCVCKSTGWKVMTDGTDFT